MMNTRERKALAICLNKNKNISQFDLFPIYKTKEARIRTIRKLHIEGYLARDKADGMLKVVQKKAIEGIQNG